MSHPQQSRAGLTLLEVLAALAILAGVVSVGSSWTIGLAKTAARTAVSSQDSSAHSRLIAVLERDLDEAMSQSVTVTDNTLDLITLHRPGERVPAWNQIRWEFDAARHHLTRIATASTSEQRALMSVREMLSDWTVTLSKPERDSEDPETLTVALRFSAGETHSVVWRRAP